ncbi:related to Zn(II)2Cys6 transcriptional activator [Cephalotrichum gorgonifer]|uniref:Related to Zn(II)2Cys6 transcriptional activator n=1 Tax=Cephalotrichum gorgonifer TaxID=2041049 RepID=A0AAE8N6F5_9PEZI|nr:related to Zn(II)2Cys6 transcriptional activator [Cephalotrichum gorgonifer]
MQHLNGPKHEARSPPGAGTGPHLPPLVSIGAMSGGGGGGYHPPIHPPPSTSNSTYHAMNGTDPDSDNQDLQSGDEDEEEVRLGKRKRPLSVSCELCKQRKVKCDRGQPSCGWCTRNGALCEYKERKKPGLRAGYGKELEQRLDRLEEVQRAHAHIIETYLAAAGGGVHMQANNNSVSTPSVRMSNASGPSDQGTPRDAATTLFRHSDPIRTPHTSDSAMFLSQKGHDYQPSAQSVDFNSLGHDGYRQSHAQQQQQGAAVAAAAAAQQQPASLLPNSATPQDYYSRDSVKLQSPGSAMSLQTGHTGPSPTNGTLEQDLPPYDLLYSLVDLYFKHIHTWCPILHRVTTFDTLFGSSPLEEADRVLLHAIVATTLRFSTDRRLTDDSRHHYYTISKRKVLLYGLDNLSVKSLQALVILALDFCGSSHGPQSWNIMALITRAVVQLGLAVETSSFSVSPNYQSIYTLRAMILPEPRDFIEEESRRRLFWIVYLLDRYATIVTAFDFSLGDRDIDRKLPCRDELWAKNQRVETRWYRSGQGGADAGVGEGGQTNQHSVGRLENLGAFAYYIDILSILSEIHGFLKEPVDISAVSDVERWQVRYKQLDQLLSQWQVGLPAEFSSMAKLSQPSSSTSSALGGGPSAAAAGGPGNKAAACSWVMLQATFHTTVIRLHSSAAYPTTRSAIFSPSYSAIQRCQVAAENVALLGEYVISQDLLSKLGPPFAFTLWVAARLLLVHGSTVEHTLSPRLHFFVSALREMGTYWGVASRYSELLQRVLDEHRDSERTGEGVTPSSVKILADMRRTAFDLDWLISHQPRHVTPGMMVNGFGGAREPAALAAAGGGGVHGSSLGGNGGAGNGNGAGGGGITPARTPAPNELEYFDVFNFFNYPRLAMGPETMFPMVDGAGAALNGGPGAANGDGSGGVGVGVGAEYINFGTFTVDATRDWL